ncbi:Photosystem II Psb28 [Macleaya cordata]|uniref:Photosystem II reaction center Psb28 protein n=1 Tax=Macleaya cordata TaxID=56857 RepID=A0A200PVQ6_MACCD|nr:Photosystem II Psb28 [Macleaya cordata]
MAAIQSLALSSPISHCPQQQQQQQQQRSHSGLVSSTRVVCRSANSSLYGQSMQLPRPRWVPLRGSSQMSGAIKMMVKPVIQFIQGTDEQTIPDVRLTKSRDGTNGMAIFSFEEPSVFDSSGELGEITGFYMIDEEGVLQSVDVSAKFVNGKPSRIEAKYIMRTPRDWDRFMRFMERYSNANGLQFVKK